MTRSGWLVSRRSGSAAEAVMENLETVGGSGLAASHSGTPASSTPPMTPASTSPAADDRRRVRRAVSCAATTSSGTAPSASSISRRAPAIESSRRARSFSRQRRRFRRTRAAPCSAGSASNGGASLITDASTSVTSSPSNARRPVSISKRTTPKAQTSARRSIYLPLRLLGRHVTSRAQDDAQLSRARGQCRRVHRVNARRRGISAERFRQSEVEDFDLLIRRDLDVRRLQIAVDDPLSHARPRGRRQSVARSQRSAARVCRGRQWCPPASGRPCTP